MLSNRLTRWLACNLRGRCIDVTRRRKPDHEIARSDGAGVYLQRWWLIPRNRWFNVYLHNYLQDDIGPELHDHPWWSVSLCLDGTLREHYLAGANLDRVVRDIEAGTIVFRSAKFAHRLALPVNSVDGRGVPVRGAMTLFITGPRIRRWGFLCPKGWVPWRRYDAARANGASGCGET